MSKFRNLLTTGAVAALLGVGAAAVSATPADARVVCNRWGDCWHERGYYHYPRGLGVRFYGDEWRWRHRHDYHWREHHDGRGYWRNGVWIAF
jgi:hypothetical protein